MKTPIVLEKDDILKLCYAFLRAKGFDIPGPDKVTYKGALQVTIQIEYNMDVSEVEDVFAPAKPAKALAKTAKTPDSPSEEPPAEGEPDIEALLRASQGLAAQAPPPFDRRLREGESLDYPGAKR